jgi:D-galacturonate reductase
VRVTAAAATGAAAALLGRPCEDTITLTAQWDAGDGGQGVAVYTASWIAPKVSEGVGCVFVWG